MAEEARSPRQDSKGGRGWPRGGPRSLFIRRYEHGFGFTLRHFIVYPPESYMVLAGDRRLGLRPGALDEPMDTIFVKQVRAGSPADQAGLRTGDRVVSVNGETVNGYSYAGVVHRIHNSGSTLHLLVVPQEDDLLQLYFNETAHRPESNLQMVEPMVRGAAWDSGARRASEAYSGGPPDGGENMQGSPGYPYPANMAGCRLSLDAAMMGRRDSTSQEGSASSLDHSSDDSVIISRIRRSCEQKEEFLRRPAGPVWPAATGPPPGIKEFYSRPQKLQPRPHWPPNISTSPNHMTNRKEREEVSPRERGFVCGGPVTNAPCDHRRTRPGFVTTLGRIQETALATNGPTPHLQVVSQRARQFESGSVPDRTSLYRSELARLSNKCIVPDVNVRAREYESKSDQHRSRESRSLDSTGSLPVVSSLSGNRLVPVGGRKLHCDPPLEHQPHSYDGSGTEDSGGTPLGSPSVVWRDKSINDTGLEEERVTRRVSYLKATWPDRMNVDSDPDVSDSEPPVSGVGARHSLSEELSLPDKENHQISQEGTLHCKLTLVDGKRATDRSWKQVWAVLRGPLLYLFKERRDSLPSETPTGLEVSSGVGMGGGEQVDVRCALVAAADNYTKRKHVLRLSTRTNSELLLQASDAGQMDKWIVALEEQANNNNTQSASGANLSPSSAKGLRKLTSLRNRSPTGQSPVTKTRKPSQQLEPASSPKSKTWKGRVAKQFRRIQHSGSPVSPTAPHPLPPPEGAAIGVPLEDCQPSSVSDYVPLLVEMCTNIVEEKGLEVIGIYRVPGNTAAVTSLTEAVNRGGPLDFSVLEQDQRWKDVNVISSLLKSFFRRLPDSLLTTELYPSFIQADKIPNPHLRMATIRKLVHDLPDHHYETLKYLLMHLKKVVEHAVMNKMEARNLAIVFGPTLVRTADDNMVTMVTDMSHQCRIVETLILHVDWCFGDETVERLSLEGVEGGELEAAVANHNLLLSNIHKMEGMTKELSARDIVSSIICAANRKMMKGKGRKAASSEEPVDQAAENKRRQDARSKSQHRKERLNSAEINADFSLQSAVAEASANQLSDPTEEVDSGAGQSGRPQLDDGTIRSYAGLSANTQERIRRFEMETKAMLHRDTSRLRRQEADSEREQSKRELEADDHVNPSAIVKKIVEPGRAGKPLAIVPPSTEGRGRSRLTAEEGGGVGHLRRGSSAENINVQISAETQANGNLKRFKSEKEQDDPGLGRCGSLDSLHDITPSERPPSNFSDEGGDLLVTLMSTFDAKLRSPLLSSANETADPPCVPSHTLFTDPSLHKKSDKEDKEETKEECCVKKDQSDSCNLLTQAETLKELENLASNEPRVVRLRRSASNRDERSSVCRSESLTKSDSFKLRRSESLNKENRSESNSKLKRSDSLTKNEKTESNLNKRRQLAETGRWNVVKLKRKTGSAIDRSIKRRHTVGGTKDFDKVNWLDNRQREAEEEGKKERRTSSPDLSSARLAAVVILRPHSFAEPNLADRLCGVPLESHV